MLLGGNFTKSSKVSSHQLNSKTNDLDCFLSPVASDGLDGLKLEKVGQVFQVLMPGVPKILKKFIMVSPV